MASLLETDPIGAYTADLKPEFVAVIDEVVATIPSVEEHSISAIRESAIDVFDGAGITSALPIDVSRVALAARLRKIEQTKEK